MIIVDHVEKGAAEDVLYTSIIQLLYRCLKTEEGGGGASDHIDVTTKCYSVDKEKQLLQLISLGTNIKSMDITFGPQIDVS